MGVSTVFMAITFILWGISLLGLLPVPAWLIGLFALVTGILIVVSHFTPLTIPVRRTIE